jgi:hypothetical protein
MNEEAMARVGPQRQTNKQQTTNKQTTYIIFIAYVIRRNVPSTILEHQENPFQKAHTEQKLCTERKPPTGKLSAYSNSDVS